MAIIERAVTQPCEGVIVEPVGGSSVGLLVLAGSSGRIDADRCRVFARSGIVALSIRWFGGVGQAPGICEIPLETFVAAIDLLQARGVRRIGVLGVSKGAEAALLLAVRDRRVDVVVALSPTSVVWANVGAGADGVVFPRRSSWTWRGEPVAFVPYDEGWTRVGDPVAYRTHYEQSLRAYPEAAMKAAIPVEQSAAEVVLVAGGNDQMWPSLGFAQDLAARRASAGNPVRLVTSPDAGHRPRLPGEDPAPHSDRFDYGGTPEADAALGAQAWPEILAALRIEPHTGGQ